MALHVLQAFDLDLPPRPGQGPGSPNRRVFQAGDRVPEAIVHRIPEDDTRTEVVAADFWDPPAPFPGAALMTPDAYATAAIAWTKGGRDRDERAQRAETARAYAAWFKEPESSEENPETPAKRIRDEDAKEPLAKAGAR